MRSQDAEILKLVFDQLGAHDVESKIQVLANRPFFLASGRDTAHWWEEAYSKEHNNSPSHYYLESSTKNFNLDSRVLSDLPSCNPYSSHPHLEDPWVMDPNFNVSLPWINQFNVYRTDFREKRPNPVLNPLTWSYNCKDVELYDTKRMEEFSLRMKHRFQEFYLEISLSVIKKHVAPVVHLNSLTDFNVLFCALLPEPSKTSGTCFVTL